jgi:hypothetical protein
MTELILVVFSIIGDNLRGLVMPWEFSALASQAGVAQGIKNRRVLS